MKCFANRVTTRLFQVPSTAPISASADGTGWRVLPEQGDRVSDALQEFKFVSSLTMAGGAGSPTAQVVIQGSVDGQSWIDLATGTSRTADGTYKEVLDNSSNAILPYIRGRFALGGSTAPNVSGVIDIISTAPFTLAS